MRIGVFDDLPTGRLDGVDGGLGREHREHVERGEDPALVRPVRMHVHDQRRSAGATSCFGDRLDHGGDPARMVPMPVRQEQHVDAGEVDRQALGVGHPHVAVGTDVEEDRRRLVPHPALGEGREPVAGDAEVVEGDDAVVAVVLSHRWEPAEQVGHLGELRNTWRDARQRVGGVVDDDGDGELIERRATGSEGVIGPWSQNSPPAPSRRRHPHGLWSSGTRRVPGHHRPRGFVAPSRDMHGKVGGHRGDDVDVDESEGEAEVEDEVEVVVAHSERATLRVGDVFLKIDGDQTRTDVEVEAMAMAPVPTPEILWRKPPVLALAALPGTALGRLGEPSTASSAAWAAAGAAARTLHDAPLPPWPGWSLDEFASHLDERVRVARRQRRPSHRRGHAQPPGRRGCAPAVDTGVHPRRPAGRPRLRRR